ncbi:MAG: T9SS type A sorting domain-containing protein [Nonlabens sp.]
MKRFLFLSFLALALIPVHAQLGLESPWMLELMEAIEGRESTYQEIVDAGNTYWESHDKESKGSGYKVFMRWVDRNAAYVKPNGMIQTSAELQQEIDKKSISGRGIQSDNSTWGPVGPLSYTNTGSWSAGQGRVNSMTVDPNDPDTYYMGTPGGGVWKSTDAGVNWTPLNDFITRVGASAVAVDHTDSNIVYVGTGDDDGGDSPSIGLLKSIDGGLTFLSTGLSFNQFSYSEITEVYVDPIDHNKIIVASDRGLYVSQNGASNFTRTFNGNIKDVKYKPGDPSTLYLTTTNQFHKSTDGGNTWNRVTAGIPFNMGRTVIGVSPADPTMVYLLIIDSSANYVGVYRSTNSGNSFSARNRSTDVLETQQGWYDLALEVSPTNANVIYTGCLNVWKSVNGGSSFNKINSWSNPTGSTYTHADIHQIRQFNDDLFVLSDGGVYRSKNDAGSFTDLTAGAQIGQFYRVSVGSNSADLAGGLQDNGGYIRSNNSWKNFYGADGMEVGIDPNDNNVRYGFTQFGGGLYVSNNAGASLAGSISGPEQGNWITPLKTDRNGTIYAGYSSLYKVQSGGFQLVSNSFNSNIDVLEIDTYDQNLMYVAVNSSLYRSTNAGQSFQFMRNMGDFITAIEASNTEENAVYVATSGSFGQVFKSMDGGSNFSNITGNLPNLGKNTLAHQVSGSGDILYVGTTAGVMALDSNTGVWEAYDSDLPNVNVRDLEINTADNIMTAATYGRGIWQTGIPMASPAIDAELASIGNGNTGSISCSSNGIDIDVKNNGQSDLTSFTIAYSINNGPVQQQNFTTTIAPQQITSVTLSNLSLQDGNNNIEAEVIAPNDQLSINNAASYATVKNITSVVNDTYGFATRTYTTGGSGWELGIPSASILNSPGSGSNSMAYATNINGEHGNNQTSYLYTGCYDLTTVDFPVLEFEMGFDIEFEYDVFYVEYSIDQGVNWDRLGNSRDSNWYNNGRSQNNSCRLCVGGQWTGTTTTGINTYSKSLIPFTNEPSILFRFVFQSDQSVTNDGVVIDNVVVNGVLSNTDLAIDDLVAIYPNPSTGEFNLQWRMETDFNYSITTLSGQLVTSGKNLSGPLYRIDLEGKPAGIYFLNITSTAGTTTKKLVLQ